MVFEDVFTTEHAADDCADVDSKGQSRNRFGPLCGVEKKNELVKGVILDVTQPMVVLYQLLHRGNQPLTETYFFVAAGLFVTAFAFALASLVSFAAIPAMIGWMIRGKLWVKKA